MIEIDGILINPFRIVSAEIETRHYMNCSVSRLVVTLDGGRKIIKEHGFGFDAYAVLNQIKSLGKMR
jgi:hypothetical protein